MSTIARAVGALAAVIGVAGCSGGSPSGDQSPTTSDAPNTTQASPYAPNVGDLALRVGQTRDGEQIDTTVRSVVTPWSSRDRFRQPDEGHYWVNLDVEVCVDAEATETAPIGWGDFTALSPDGARYLGDDSTWPNFPSPQFPVVGELSAGQCAVGHVLIPVPEGAEVDRVALIPAGGSQPTAAEWVLPAVTPTTTPTAVPQLTLSGACTQARRLLPRAPAPSESDLARTLPRVQTLYARSDGPARSALHLLIEGLGRALAAYDDSTSVLPALEASEEFDRGVGRFFKACP